MEIVYLDNNGTTCVDPRVLNAVVEEMNVGPANPSSIHYFGRNAKKRLNHARETIAHFFGADPSEILFTSSGTEALNLAILGIQTQDPMLAAIPAISS